MRRCLVLALACVLVLAAACGRVAPQRPLNSPVFSSLSGRVIVFHTEAPLPNARVVLEGSRTLEIQTDSLGRFLFSELVPGRYMLSARLLGYSPQRKEIDILKAPSRVLIALEAGTMCLDCDQPLNRGFIRILP